MRIADDLHPDVRAYLEPRVTVDRSGRRRVWLPVVDRIEAKLAAPNANGCIEWQGYRCKKGYGTPRWRGVPGLVHRIVLELATGKPIPPGMLACHHRDNPPCCNADHLYVGSAAQNTADARGRGRLWSPNNEASRSAKLSNAQVAELRVGWAEGVTCTQLASRYGLHRSYISRLARGMSRPPLDGVLPQRESGHVAVQAQLPADDPGGVTR